MYDQSNTLSQHSETLPQSSLQSPPSQPATLQASSPKKIETLPKVKSRAGRKFLVFALVTLIATGALGYAFKDRVAEWFGDKREDLLTHVVKEELIPITIVERGVVESANNQDVICRVKAGARGSYSSTIKWVIDDGSYVNQNQLLMELDDSALVDSRRTQNIIVNKATSEWVKAVEDYKILRKQNESDIAQALATLRVAELDLVKYVGLNHNELLNPMGALLGAYASLEEKGEYRSLLDDISNRLKLAESDLEAYRDRSAWATRAVKQNILTPSQAKVEEAKYDAARDLVAKLRKEKFVLENFTRTRELTNLNSAVNVARMNYETVQRQALAKEIQADFDAKTKKLVLDQEEEKLLEIDMEIQKCRIVAPQAGMVVYHKERSRFGSSSETMIAVGEQVKEGQKLFHIPDLERMQVATKIHESLAGRVKGDEKVSTGIFSSLRAGLLVNPHPFSRFMSQSQVALSSVLEANRDAEYRIKRPGQNALIRVDALGTRLFKGHVSSIAAVASQKDWYSSDVKVFDTIALIDDPNVKGLKPDMSAQVIIEIEKRPQAVIAIPIQAVVGAAELKGVRKIFVLENGKPVEREVELGIHNDFLVEVLSGLKVGETVILNPKVLVEDNSKTRDDPNESAGKQKKGFDPKSKGKMQGKGGPGGPKGGPGGAPKGAPKS